MTPRHPLRALATLIVFIVPTARAAPFSKAAGTGSAHLRADGMGRDADRGG